MLGIVGNIDFFQILREGGGMREGGCYGSILFCQSGYQVCRDFKGVFEVGYCWRRVKGSCFGLFIYSYIFCGFWLSLGWCLVALGLSGESQLIFVVYSEGCCGGGSMKRYRLVGGRVRECFRGGGMVELNVKGC